MVNCEIVGHKTYPTTGIIVKKSNLILDRCVVYNHLSGGISLYLKKENSFECLNSVIVHNKNSGIDIMGLEGKVYLS